MGEGGICFDAMDLREEAESEPMDFSVVLTDIHGNRAVFGGNHTDRHAAVSFRPHRMADRHDPLAFFAQ